VTCGGVCAKDSTELTDKDRCGRFIYNGCLYREKLVAHVLDADARVIVITHGTDTMLATAACLQRACTDRAIVITGAMRPAAFKATDADFNLGGLGH
jgi:L-asparaginase